MPAVFYGFIWLGFSQALSGSYLFPSPETMNALLISGEVNWVGFIGFLFLSFVVITWLAVGWHRFVLMEERPNLIGPKMNFLLVAGYIWRVIIVVVVILFLSIPLGLALFLPVFLFASMEPSVVAIAAAVASILLTIIVSVVLLRISLILPAIAIDEPITVSEAWDYSSDKGWAIWQIASVVAVTRFVSQLPATYLEASVTMSVLTFLLGMIYTFLNLSILTTLYGHWVEERALAL